MGVYFLLELKPVFSCKTECLVGRFWNLILPQRGPKITKYLVPILCVFYSKEEKIISSYIHIYIYIFFREGKGKEFPLEYHLSHNQKKIL